MRSRPVFPIALVLLAAAIQGPAEEQRKPLPQKHAKAGVTCHDCHRKENPAKAAVADDSCMTCHGDYAAMDDYTKHLKPNPHRPPSAKHPAQAPCVDCHRQHRPAVVKCVECHPDFKLKAR